MSVYETNVSRFTFNYIMGYSLLARMAGIMKVGQCRLAQVHSEKSFVLEVDQLWPEDDCKFKYLNCTGICSHPLSPNILKSLRFLCILAMHKCAVSACESDCLKHRDTDIEAVRQLFCLFLFFCGREQDKNNHATLNHSEPGS